MSLNLETFFESFGHLADAPNGVQKLRELILQLAVQGKLVPQDANDEPVAALLNTVAAEKERINRGKVGKNGRSMSVVDSQEFPIDAPSTWLFCRFGDLAEIISGVTKGRNLTGKETAFFPYLRVANVQRGFLELDVMKEIEVPTHELDKYRLIKNDIVITEGGDWDKVGRAAIWKEQINNCIHQNHVFRARLYSSAILPQWIILFVNSPLGRRYFEAASKQTTNLASINMGQLRHCPIPIPSTNEQHRIVAKVDQLMALCDELEARQQKQQTARVRLNNAALDRLLTARATEEFAEHWQRICDNFDLLYDAPETVNQLRQAILQLAVQGKLVAQDANDEPAAVLLAKIKAEKERLIQEKKIKRSDPLPPIEADEMHFELPQGWEWVRMGSIAEQRLGKMLDKSKNKGKPYPYLRNTNVQWLRFDLSDVKEMRFEDDELEEYELRAGDLLICEGGEPGRCAIWNEQVKPMMFQKAIHRVRPFAFTSPKFLLYRLLADAKSGYLEKHFTGATIKHFTGQELSRYVFGLPPLAEQRRIVAKVDQLMALCDELETKLRQAQAHSAKLMTATVQHLAAV
jgi:type I restriction enzyme, S subunit